MYPSVAVACLNKPIDHMAANEAVGSGGQDERARWIGQRLSKVECRRASCPPDHLLTKLASSIMCQDFHCLDPRELALRSSSLRSVRAERLALSGPFCLVLPKNLLLITGDDNPFSSRVGGCPQCSNDAGRLVVPHPYTIHGKTYASQI